MDNHHLDNGSTRCVLKVDIIKAFDIVSYNFIIQGLRAISIPDRIVKWNQTCLSIIHFSVALKGEVYGFFRCLLGVLGRVNFSPFNSLSWPWRA
jgi:hypothetical protein